MGKGRVPASREYTLMDQAVKIYHNTHSEQEARKFIDQSCAYNIFLATDLHKQFDYRLFREDLYDL